MGRKEERGRQKETRKEIVERRVEHKFGRNIRERDFIVMKR